VGGFGDSLAQAAHILSSKPFFRKEVFTFFMSIKNTTLPETCSKNLSEKFKNY